ncbi:MULTISPECIES: response regulator transcription factor [Clostridia]|uniref:response regulator transcription factor n=1 Tax=Clostridia TaxID=186801 RepID=UPI000EA130FD|nr:MULTISPECIES: response regulator transcription factor [Clostridia]NBJ70599.1 DNA-binding response regulator [Roseburia sp. 1XD42-34]RKI76599.1 DNA-binding response regulator [Clostridium sp. 1xD42-85]
MITVLVVDDDAHIRELLRLYLQKEGYQMLEAEDGKEALSIMEQTHVRAAIVDIMMPKLDGYELCKDIRTFYDIPVLMLTAKGEIADKEKAFIAGTDDYIVKPFEPKEVLFRLKALLRRFQMIHNDKIRIGTICINRKNYEVQVDGKTIILPLKEFELLAQLASYPNQIFTREQLIEHVWGLGYEGNARTVDVHIKRLRERFADCQDDFTIQTVRGIGYKLEMLKAGGQS